jgi:glycosyltransferase involved in cell wall biosynthesis
MMAGALADELDIVVVCNGCTDGTAERARALGPPVRVIELEAASKVEALNRGDDEVRGFPRFYVDADVELPIQSMRATAKVLEGTAALAAAPRLVVDVRDRPWSVRAYYRAWLSLPYFSNGMIGSGVYALSAAGRARFQRFPHIIADDGYVRLLFSRRERVSVPECTFTIRPPKTLGGVIHIKTRARAGGFELRQRFPELCANDDSGARMSILRMLFRPRLWPDYIVYAFVTAIAVCQGRLKIRSGRAGQWERDESSRQAADHSGTSVSRSKATLERKASSIAS